MGAIEKTVDAVAAKVGGACQLVVICGRNKRLIARLRAKCVLILFFLTMCGGSQMVCIWRALGNKRLIARLRAKCVLIWLSCVGFFKRSATAKPSGSRASPPTIAPSAWPRSSGLQSYVRQTPERPPSCLVRAICDV